MRLTPLVNVFRIPELRKMIVYTIILLGIFRIGSIITLPGVDPGAFSKAAETTGMIGLVSMFTGGALSRAAVFGLGIMPFISASIIFQLLTTVIKPLEELSKEGEVGRKKINQYTRYATVALCLIQSIMMSKLIAGFGAKLGRPVIVPEFEPWFPYLCMITLTGGSIFLMWLGEQITENGIGQGISLIIMGGIVSRLPSSLSPLFDRLTVSDLFVFRSGKMNLFSLAVVFAVYIGVVMAVVVIQQGERRVPVQHAKLTRGRKVYSGQRHYMPLRVNAAGVIPIIFAQSLLMIPGTVLGMMRGMLPNSAFIDTIQRMLAPGQFTYLLINSILIFFFCYFWTAVQFNPIRLADDMKEHGAFVPGIRPGRRTAEYLERVMGRITLAGSAFLVAIALLPLLMPHILPIPSSTGLIFGGTGLLIVVGVALDLVRKIETHLIMRHYDGFMKSGRVKGRFT